jgi:hypothetical protein
MVIRTGRVDWENLINRWAMMVVINRRRFN